MLAKDIVDLRKELGCSVRELSLTLGVPLRLVQDWEAGDAFPTKRHADRMRGLLEQGASAIVRSVPKKAMSQTLEGTARLSDPKLWLLVRKLVEYPELFAEALEIGEKYPEPGTKG